MAIFFFEVKTFGRARGKAGSSSTSAAAYRSGERIHDHRTGRSYDHSARQDVLHKEIIVPSRFVDSDMSWAQDRSTLWNAAEAAESRKNARVAREYLVGLPVELKAEQRTALVRHFSQTLSDRYQNAVDVAIHAPRPEGDERNFHAHLLTTTREVSPDGMGLKTTLDISSTARQMRGLQAADNEYLWVREQWAAMTNEALRSAGLSVRVDPRTLQERGLDPRTSPRIPTAAREIERRGERSYVAERIRQEEQQRAMAQTSNKTVDLDEIRRQARENWRLFREQQKMGTEEGLTQDRSASAGARPPDHELA